jgi:hypothetical protein
VDGRRIYDREEALALGFTYKGIGAPCGRPALAAPRVTSRGTEKEVIV